MWIVCCSVFVGVRLCFGVLVCFVRLVGLGSRLLFQFLYDVVTLRLVVVFSVRCLLVCLRFALF